MSILKDVIKEEKERLEEIIVDYENRLKKYRKGSIIVKKIAGKSYTYLASRKGNKVVTEYVGRDVSKEATTLEEHISERKKIEKQLKTANANYKEVVKLSK